MSAPEDRVEQALAAFIEHLEVGGPEPDVSHLEPEELERLRELIALLDQTEGIAFGHGMEESGEPVTARTPEGERVVAAMSEALPPSARVATDPAATGMGIAGLHAVEGWVVGTFGGRIRVWLVGGEEALGSSEGWLRDLDRVFRTFPDTAALALVDEDLSCLLVQPEDCAPNIEVPRGSLVGRRYRRPVQPVSEALSVFFRELIPYWDPIQEIGDQAVRTVEIEPIAHERSSHAVHEQVAAGTRARKTNPKRKALQELGEREAAELAKLVLDVHDGRAAPEAVEEELRRLASNR